MPLWAWCFWVFASKFVAFLPLRRQYLPGSALVLIAPFLMVWISLENGWWAGLLALAAFLSMYRKLMCELWRRVCPAQKELLE